MQQRALSGLTLPNKEPLGRLAQPVEPDEATGNLHFPNIFTQTFDKLFD